MSETKLITSTVSSSYIYNDSSYEIAKYVDTHHRLQWDDPSNSITITGITFNTNQEVSMKRIVNIVIADPHPAVPIEKSILKGIVFEPTDLSDEDLLYSYNLNELVTEHNKYRVTVDDTTVARLPDGSFPKLKPIKVSELRKLVITVAHL